MVTFVSALSLFLNESKLKHWDKTEKLTPRQCESQEVSLFAILYLCVCVWQCECMGNCVCKGV